MPRIAPVSKDTATGKAAELLGGVEKALGMAPNIMATMAQSPGVLEAYLGFGKSLGAGSLSPGLREQIAVTVAGANSCTYCASAHTALGKNFGVDEAELARNLEGASSDDKTQAALTFAERIVSERGWVSDDEFKAVVDAGFSHAEVVEIIATVAINIFTNYFNHIVKTDIDFPIVEVNAPVA